MAEQKVPSEAEEQGAWGRPLPNRYGEIFMAVALLATALFFVVLSALLPFGSVSLPGSGFFPFALGVALGLLALAVLYGSVREDTGEIVFLGHRDVLVALAALAVLALTFEIDAYVALGVFTTVLLLLVARTTAWRSVLAGVVTMAAVWLIFKIALGVRLPAAEFWDTLPLLSMFEGR